MPFTARNLYRLSGDTVPDDINLLDPAINIRLGTQYLGRLGQKFKGSLPLVAAAYNAGPHRVENWLVNFGQLDTDEFIEHIPNKETRNYEKKVHRHHTLYRRLYAKDLKTVDLLAKTLGVPIPTRAATRETWESM
jgi:soluble lytic murein transglycosylase